MAAAARRWLEDAGATVEEGPDQDRAFNALPLAGVRVSLAERGRAVCSLRVPPHLTVRSCLPPFSLLGFFAALYVYKR
jgi:acyl-coenzyme A thioesterase 13